MPSLNAEVYPQLLDVFDEMPGGVFFKFGVRCRAPAAALIEKDDAIAIGIVVAAHRRTGTAARAAMNGQNRDAVRIADLLVVKFMQWRDAQPALRIRSERRIEPDTIAYRRVRYRDIGCYIGRRHSQAHSVGTFQLSVARTENTRTPGGSLGSGPSNPDQL